MTTNPLRRREEGATLAGRREASLFEPAATALCRREAATPAPALLQLQLRHRVEPALRPFLPLPLPLQPPPSSGGSLAEAQGRRSRPRPPHLLAAGAASRHSPEAPAGRPLWGPRQTRRRL
jgi:hypothetical protein